MQLNDIERILRENKAIFDLLEEYDRTGHLPTEKLRRSFTIERRTYQKLQELSKRQRKSMSGLLDKAVAQL